TGEAPAIGRATILVVEDEGAVRYLAARLLSRAGYEVLQAASGEEAVASARQHRGTIDLVLSDVVMPGRSGSELMAEISEICPSAATLLMSGYPRGEIARRGLGDQDVHIIEKPFTAEVLLEKVHEALLEQGVRSRGDPAVV